MEEKSPQESKIPCSGISIRMEERNRNMNNYPQLLHIIWVVPVFTVVAGVVFGIAQFLVYAALLSVGVDWCAPALSALGGCNGN
jgi:hypothetical protein